MQKTLLTSLLLAILFFALYPLTAYMMSSETYRIQSDSLNVGGVPENSITYKTDDTIGETFAGESNSETYNIKAGYQRMQETTISITVSDSVGLSGDIPSISGGTSSGQELITVKTDDPAGYKLELNASSTPALKAASDSFADYTPQNAPTLDYNWMIGASMSRFGFTVSGADATQAYKNAGTQCNQAGGAADGIHCWNGFAGSSRMTVAQSNFPNHPAGTQTTVNYFAQVKSNGFQTPGRYDSFITATATSL
jgi:hypothetical protein